MIDDVLIHGSTQDEHDQRLIAVLERLNQAKVTLNQAKCEFSKHRIKFLGQILDGSGVQPEQVGRSLCWVDTPVNYITKNLDLQWSFAH